MTPEFSKLIDTTKLVHAHAPLTFSATTNECSAISKRLGILKIANLDATVYVTALESADPFMRFDIQLTATLSQTCVVSLQPVEETIDETFALLLSHEEEEDLSTDDSDQMDWMKEEHETLYMGGHTALDIGEILVQYLSLFMNPYPRHPEASLEQPSALNQDESPLAQLKGLKKDPEQNP
jgi:hypothetical protein